MPRDLERERQAWTEHFACVLWSWIAVFCLRLVAVCVSVSLVGLTAASECL